MDKYIGKRLDGRYEIKEIIGVGGMAYVYKAHDNIDDRIVAVKILKEEFLTNDEFIRRFKNESKAIAILSHPNIVKVLDVSFSDTLQYIVMEYIDGITLKEYLEQQKGAVKWKEAVHFTTQILRALQHAHDKGIVHRDIKPQNIMLLPDGTIKMTDFGIARFSRQDIRVTAAENKAIGSVHYISPEQARGEITDEKADIYSVGVMLYEMLTGRVPFDADNAVSVAIMQLQSEPTMIHEINAQTPEGLEEITMKAMQKDPTDRYQSAAEMLQDIDSFKRNPSIRFEYKYFVDDQPTRFVDTITEVRGEEPAEEYDEEPEEKEKKFPIIPVLAGIAVAFVVAALIFVGVALSTELFGGTDTQKLIMDDFVGDKYTDVVNNVENLKKYKFKQNTEYSSEYPEGYIIKTDPPSGREVFINCEVICTVSLGENLVDIPEILAGEDKDEVRQKLRNVGFETTFVYETSETVAEGYVTRIDPDYPNSRPYGSLITIFVSNGTEPVQDVEVPPVTAQDKNQAISQLKEAGFVVSESDITYINYADTRYTAGTVISQVPAAGAMLAPGSPVKLTVASGYQDAKLTVSLPATTTPIDLQVYVAGRLSAKPEFSTQLQGLLPSDLKMLELTFTEQQSSYMVSFKIRAAGQGTYADYVSFMVNGLEGTVSQATPYEPFNDPSQSTTSSTESTTSSSTDSTTDPTASSTDPSGDSTTDPSGDSTTDPTASSTEPSNNVTEPSGDNTTDPNTTTTLVGGV